VNTVALIRKKRDGGALESGEIAALIARYSQGEVPDYQMAAMAMAVLFQGLDTRELVAWTNAMLDSGDRLTWDFGPMVDKHSTGGVGDKTSLVLAPVCASLGLHVPMISGRGLGHTGGTLDKLESIPGYRVALDTETLRTLVRDFGMVICGQTGDIVPADKRLYALRDVTGTVESIPLIASSIMSKKLAEGLDALVLDVKVGSGAFMRTEERARQLGRTMVDLGEAMGVRTRVVLSSMNEPLGRAVGNAMEVREAIAALNGEGPDDLVELVVTLAAHMLTLGGVSADTQEGRAMALGALNDGSAWSTWLRAVAAQGGQLDVLEDPSKLPAARHRRDVVAERSGVLKAVDTRKAGLAAVRLGAGRATMADVIDCAVGFEFHLAIGDAIQAGQPLATLHYNDAEPVEEAAWQLRDAIHIADTAEPQKLVLGII
jgi:pyrimidine-nucleoside phosphorylase